jgi:PAS domain S-box-containing protein
MTPVAPLSRSSFEAVLTKLADIVMVVDAADRISFMNHIAPGYENSAVIGQPVESFIVPEQQAAMLERMQRVRTTGETEEYEATSTTLDGVHTWWSSRMTRIKAENGEPLVLIVAHDVTTLRLTEAGRLAAEQELSKVMELLPICAWCKSVRDDEGYWADVATYVQNTTGAKVTHSICPACTAGFLAESGG